MKFQRFILVLPLIWAIQACTTNRVAYDYDQSIDFVAFKSYQWMEKETASKPDPRIKNDLLDARVRNAINTTLRNKRYVEANIGQIDFLVTYQLGIEKKVEADRIHTGVGFGYRYFDLGFHTDTVVREYDQVTMYIDIVDPKTKKLIWRGSRIYRYNNGGSVAERDQRIFNIVGEILSRFPPVQ